MPAGRHAAVGARRHGPTAANARAGDLQRPPLSSMTRNLRVERNVRPPACQEIPRLSSPVAVRSASQVTARSSDFATSPTIAVAAKSDGETLLEIMLSFAPWQHSELIVLFPALQKMRNRLTDHCRRHDRVVRREINIEPEKLPSPSERQW